MITKSLVNVKVPLSLKFLTSFVGLFLFPFPLTFASSTPLFGPSVAFSSGQSEKQPESSMSGVEQEIQRHLARGERLIREKRYDAAVEELESIFILAPAHEEASKRLDELKQSFILEERVKEKGRLQSLEASLKKEDEEAIERAGVFLQEGKVSEARMAVRQALARDPQRSLLLQYLERIDREEKYGGEERSKTRKTF